MPPTAANASNLLQQNGKRQRDGDSGESERQAKREKSDDSDEEMEIDDEEETLQKQDTCTSCYLVITSQHLFHIVFLASYRPNQRPCPSSITIIEPAMYKPTSRSHRRCPICLIPTVCNDLLAFAQPLTSLSTKIQRFPENPCNVVSRPESGRHTGKNGAGVVRVARIGNNCQRCSRRLYAQKGLADVRGLYLNLCCQIWIMRSAVCCLSIPELCNIMSISCYLLKPAQDPTAKRTRIIPTIDGIRPPTHPIENLLCQRLVRRYSGDISINPQLVATDLFT